MKVYSLKKKKSTQEIHVFEMTQVSVGNCISSGKNSFCNKVGENEVEECTLTGITTRCLTENGARVTAAKIGRQVCGVCVSKFYESY